MRKRIAAPRASTAARHVLQPKAADSLIPGQQRLRQRRVEALAGCIEAPGACVTATS